MESTVGIQSYGDSIWFDYLRDGLAFARGTINAASVGNFSEVQLFNPAGSGVTILLYYPNASVDASLIAIDFRIFNVALAALVGTGLNLLVGGAAAVGELRTATPAARDGTLVTTLNVGSGIFADRFPYWTVELDAGEGVLVAPNTVNTTMYAEYFWVELPA